MVLTGEQLDVDALYNAAERDFDKWQLVADLVDESIDLALNYRQSGHPGGSRSKLHMLLALLFSGAMHWDLPRPRRPAVGPCGGGGGRSWTVSSCRLATRCHSSTPRCPC